MSTNDFPDVGRARNQLAGLFTYGRQPDPEVEADARRRLAVAKVDREIRRAMVDAPAPDDVDLAHLVGLLVTWTPVAPGGDASARLERLIREVIYCTPRIDPLDVAQVLAMVAEAGESS